MLGEKEAQKLCQEVLRRCEGGQAEVLLVASDSSLTRFANNLIHQNVAECNVELSVRVVLGDRSGSAGTNRLDPAALDEAVQRARQSAEASPPDPHFSGLAGPAQYVPVQAYDAETAGYSPQQRAQAVGVVCRQAGEKGLNASGAFSTGASELVAANSLGLFAYHPFSQADFQTVVMAEDASGWSQASGWQVEQLPPIEQLGQEAISKAETGRGARLIDPGEYTVVFDAYVSEDLVGLLNFYGMGAQAVLDGRSWMNDRMGQAVMSPLVSIKDDGLDPDGIPAPFDYEGTPKRRVDIVSRGVIGSPVYDRYTARKAGVESTGHALPPEFRSFSPVATNLMMEAGSATIEEMIRSTERGLYITRFWYTRLVHPRDCVVTGMTRDGVFMIENGELAYPVKNLRFTQSYVQALAEVEMVGRERRVLASEYGQIVCVVPALKIGRFNFTGSTV